MEDAPCLYDVELLVFDDLGIEQNYCGSTEWDEERETYIIKIRTGTELETLIHEYAHALTWDTSLTDHDSVYWAMYGELYRILMAD